MMTFVFSERFQRLFKEGFWILLGQIAMILGSLVGVRILTGMLTPAIYGELALAMTAATFINQLIMGPLGNGITRFYAPAFEKRDLGGYFKAVHRLVLLATGIVLVVCLIAVFAIYIAGKIDLIVITVVTCSFALFNGYNSILSGIQNAARQRLVVALHQGGQPWIRFLLAAGLIVLFGATSTVAMVGYALGVVCVLFSQWAFFLKRFGGNTFLLDGETKWLREIWKYSLPFSTWGIFTWLQLASDRWFLGFFSTTQDVGKYAVLYQLGYYPMSIATDMAVQFLAPVFYQRAGDASDSQRNASVSVLSWRLAALAVGITGVAFLVTFVFRAQIFSFFVAKEYANVSYLLPWVVLSGGVFASGQTLTLNLMSRMKTNYMTVTKIITAIIGIVLNFFGAYFYGVAGVVFASLIFSVSYCIWIALISKGNVSLSRVK